jgi:hypothetical protein
MRAAVMATDGSDFRETAKRDIVDFINVIHPGCASLASCRCSALGAAVSKVVYPRNPYPATAAPTRSTLDSLLSIIINATAPDQP